MGTTSHDQAPTTTHQAGVGNAPSANWSEGQTERVSEHDKIQTDLSATKIIRATARLAFVNGLAAFEYMSPQRIARGPAVKVESPDLLLRAGKTAKSLRILSEKAAEVRHPIGEGLVFAHRDVKTQHNPEQLLVVLPLFDFLELVAQARGLVRETDPFDIGR